MTQPAAGRPSDSQEKDAVEVEVLVDGMPLGLAPFVRQIVAATVFGLLSTLKGTENAHEFQIRVRRKT